MKAIYKYPLKVKDEQTIDLPLGAQILDVQLQRNDFYLWALVDQIQPFGPVKFRIFGTGMPIPSNLHLTHLKSIQKDMFMWHIFIEDNGQTIK